MNANSKLQLNLSPAMRKHAEALAAAEGLSLEDFLVITIAEKLAHAEHRAWLAKSGIESHRIREARLRREPQESSTEQDMQSLKELFQDAPVFVALLAGTDHVFEMVNESYLELMGHRDFIGRRVVDIVPEVAGTVWIDHLNRVFQTGEAWVERGARLSISPAAGAPLQDKFIDYTYKPRRDPNGSITGIVAIGMDTTTVRAVMENAQGGEFLLGDTMESSSGAQPADG